MEFLKAIFGDKYEEFTSIIKAYNDNPENKDKQIKLADLNAGEYVSKKTMMQWKRQRLLWKSSCRQPQIH